jgi:glycosyltransferase involved in cell wall biosynthesis
MPETIKPRENRMRKVLMVAHVFPPFRSVGHSIRVVKFIKFLPKLGWLPVVLTIDDQKEYQEYEKQGSESLFSDIPDGVAIYRTNSGEPSLEYLEKENNFGKKNFLSAIFVKIFKKARGWIFRNLLLPDWHVAWLPYALRRGRQILKNEGIDAIFATCPPHSAALIGAFLKLLSQKPLILDFRDDWIGTPWYESRPRLIQFIERRMESWAVRTADAVILVTEWSRNAFLNRYPNLPSDKFVFISNGVDLEEFSLSKSLDATKHDSKFTITHAGSLNDSVNWKRSPAVFFQAVHNIVQRQPELMEELTLAFTGSLPERQRKLVDELGLSRTVKELGFLSQVDFLQLMKASKLLLVINYEGFSTLIPGKIYEYWAIGGPPILLLSCTGAASSLIEQYGLGLTAEPNDVAGIEVAILSVYQKSKSASPMQMSTKGIEAFDRQVLTQKLAKVLFSVFKERVNEIGIKQDGYTK